MMPEIDNITGLRRKSECDSDQQICERALQAGESE